MYYADNPIVVYHNFLTGSPDHLVDVFPEGAVCRTIEIRVSYQNSRTYKFKTEVGTTPVPFDISSSARAELLGDYLRQPGTQRTASVSATVSAYARWMISGVQHISPVQLKLENQQDYAFSQTIQVRAGGLPAFNRFIGQTSNTYNSLKPSADEIVNIGDSYYHNGQITNINTTNFPVLANLPATITIDGRSIYVMDAPERKTIVFLNSFCEFESFSMLTKESISFDVTTEKRSLESAPSFVPNPAAMAVHSDPNGSFKLSSGFMPIAWLQWVLTEFVKSSHHWLVLNGRLLPVIVTPAENNLVYDKANPELVAVNFTAESAIAGPLLIES